MKKIIAISLVAILAVGSVFAAFSGSASVGFGGNLDNGNYGFLDQSTNVKFDLELATDSAEKAGAEDGIYASIKASLVVRAYNGEKGLASSTTPQGRVGVVATLDEAKIGGENWYVSILGMPDGPDYAKSAIDTYKVSGEKDKWNYTKANYTKNYSFAVPYASTNGLEVGVFDYTFGFGLLGDYDETNSSEENFKQFNFAVFAETPEYDFSGVKVQAAATFSQRMFDTIEDSVAKPLENEKPSQNIGLAAKVGYENDTIKASVATDLGVNVISDKYDPTIKNEDRFDMDVAAAFTYDFLTVDAYYATNPVVKYKNVGYDTLYKGFDGTNRDYLSAQVVTDLNAFNVPVELTVFGKDLLRTAELGVKAEVAPIEGLTLTTSASYVINTVDVFMDKDVKDAMDCFMGQWKASFDAEYDFGYATVAAGISAKNIGLFDFMTNEADLNVDAFKDVKSLNGAVNKVLLGLSASVKTTALIPGAELALTWADADDVLKLYNYKYDTYNNFGSITASATIEF